MQYYDRNEVPVCEDFKGKNLSITVGCHRPLYGNLKSKPTVPCGLVTDGHGDGNLKIAMTAMSTILPDEHQYSLPQSRQSRPKPIKTKVSYQVDG
jgi:hypothetical protein